jgi:hypothetical protein
VDSTGTKVRDPAIYVGGGTTIVCRLEFCNSLFSYGIKTTFRCTFSLCVPEERSVTSGQAWQRSRAVGRRRARNTVTRIDMGKLRITRRGHKMQVTLAKIELAMDGLIAVDRLLVLNQALSNVLDDAGGR